MRKPIDGCSRKWFYEILGGDGTLNLISDLRKHTKNKESWNKWVKSRKTTPKKYDSLKKN